MAISEYGTVPLPRVPPTPRELFEVFSEFADHIETGGSQELRRHGINMVLESRRESAIAAEVLRWAANHCTAWPSQGIA